MIHEGASCVSSQGGENDEAKRSEGTPQSERGSRTSEMDIFEHSVTSDSEMS